MTIPKLNPGSLVHQTLIELQHLGECSSRDYLRVLKNISPGGNGPLGDDLKRRGLVERRVVLTDKARRALEALE